VTSLIRHSGGKTQNTQEHNVSGILGNQTDMSMKFLQNSIDNEHFFKRPSEQAGIGNRKDSSLIVKKSHDFSTNNHSRIMMQQSFDDLCVCDPMTARSKADGSPPGERPSNVCKHCTLEKEKRQVTQKAFERALGISLFLIEEIDKLKPGNQS
jgi:hypothetical protein